MNTYAALERAWKQGQQIASLRGEKDLSPWDALASEVRRSAYRSDWLDEQAEQSMKTVETLKAALVESMDKDELQAVLMVMREAQGDARYWLDMSLKERQHGARVAKSSLDAGLAEYQVQTAQVEVRTVIQLIKRAMEAASMSDEQKELVRHELQVALPSLAQEVHNRMLEST